MPRTDAATLSPPRAVRRPRPAEVRRRSRARRGVAGGAVWIGVVGVLLAGVVALNVAVLRLNLQLDQLSVERTQLRGETAALASQVSSAAASPRIYGFAARRLGLVPAGPDHTTYIELRPRR